MQMQLLLQCIERLSLLDTKAIYNNNNALCVCVCVFFTFAKDLGFMLIGGLE